VFDKRESDDAENSFDLLRVKDEFRLADLNEIKPPGLPLEWQQYLYDKIWEFVKPESQDITCRQPETISVPSSVTPTLVADMTVTQPVSPSVSSKHRTTSDANFHSS